MPPILGSPRPEVIDAFWREVLKGHRPTLGHRMLGALAGALRIDLLLTTNFDDLLEKAFEAARNPLQVFEVMLDGTLPQRIDVETDRTLVKMHGGRIALRADYSLDEPPTSADIDHFVSYLMSPRARAQFADHQARALINPAEPYPPGGYESEKHLLVFGFSGTDRRIIQFVREALSRLDKDFRVYWIGFKPDDDPSPKLRDGGGFDKFLFHPCTNLGLLFLQLYQRLRNDLPPLGSIFPSASRLTLPPTEGARMAEAENWTQRSGEFLTDLEKTLIPESDAEANRIVLALADDHTGGLTTLSAEVFVKLETKPDILEIWIDLNNVSSTENLFEVLLEAVHYRTGVEDWTPATMKRKANENDFYPSAAKELKRHLDRVSKRWIVFLNARETPGANTYEGTDWGRNGWLEQPSPALESSDDNKSFARLLDALTKESPCLTFVVVATDEPKAFNDPFWTSDAVVRAPLKKKNSDPGVYTDQVFDRSRKWFEEAGSDSKGREHFLHALVRAQRPRFPASLWSPAFFPDEEDRMPSDERRRRIDKYLGGLTECGLVRRNPGGMVWVHSGCREQLRTYLTDKGSFSGRIHVDLAAWYEKVVDDLESPDAVFEAAYHFCKAAEAYAKRRKEERRNGKRLTDLKRAASLVDAATAQIRSESFLIQTHGFSRGSCRHLSRIGDIGAEILNAVGTPDNKRQKDDINYELKPAIRKLWLACAETMRAVAREVGEDSKAFGRHRMVAYLYLEEAPVWKTCKEQAEGPFQESDGRRGKLLAKVGGTEREARLVYWRWVRWSAMLGIGTRAYKKVEDLLHKSVPKQPKSRLLGPLSDQGTYFRVTFTEKVDAERIEFLRLIEQAVQLRLLVFGTNSRLAKLDGGHPDNNAEKQKETLQYAENMIRRGMRLAASIRDHDHSSVSPSASQAIWCETRLLIHLSTVHALARVVGFTPCLSRDPLGILSDAEAKLRAADPQRTRAELALIDLHRADAKLNEPDCAKVAERLSAMFLGHYFVPWHYDVTSLRNAAACASDAIRFLDRAESVMRERRRNVWWTAWYFERKLRAIACVVLATCPFPDKAWTGPIPHLGLEAAMRLSETEADRLLKDAQRMVRVDAYRLATILEAYVHCLLAFVYRIAADAHTPRMENRIQRMEEGIEEGYKSLKAVYDARAAHLEDLDAGVLRYIRRILGFESSPSLIYQALTTEAYRRMRRRAVGKDHLTDYTHPDFSRLSP